MTLVPGRLNLAIYRGDPFSVTLSSQLDGVDETVTANQALAQIRKDDDTLVATLTVTATNGGKTATCSLTASQTASLPIGRWAWDFQPSPTADTWVGGHVQVHPDASHP